MVKDYVFYNRISVKKQAMYICKDKKIKDNM